MRDATIGPRPCQERSRVAVHVGFSCVTYPRHHGKKHAPLDGHSGVKTELFAGFAYLDHGLSLCYRTRLLKNADIAEFSCFPTRYKLALPSTMSR